MADYRYPFEDAVFVVTNVGKDRSGRQRAVVAVQTSDGHGFIALPREMVLWEEREWRKLSNDAAVHNGLKPPEWFERTKVVRAGLWDDLSKVDVDIEEELDESRLILREFPRTAWLGLFADYREIVAPTTEAPDVYHYFTFAITFGATLARRVYVYHAVPLFPNFYIALVGRTGMARKDTARARSNRLLRELHANDDPENPRFLLLPGIGSAEGLIEALGGDGKVIVAQEAELLSLMAKAKRDATSNLLPHLTALYDCPDLYTLKTRTKPVTCKNTFLSLLVGTTPTWLKRSMSEEHALSGFANRFMFVYGDPKAPIPFPPPVDDDAWGVLAHQVNSLREWAEAQQQLTVSDDAIDHFSEWYGQYHQKVSAEGLLPALAVRFQSFAWKLALLYAVQQRSPVVDTQHLTPALDVADWLWDSNRSAFVDFIEKGRGLEDAILQRLAEAHPMPKRSLYKALHVSAAELERATGPMTRMGLIREVLLKASSGREVDALDIV